MRGAWLLQNLKSPENAGDRKGNVKWDCLPPSLISSERVSGDAKATGKSRDGLPLGLAYHGESGGGQLCPTRCPGFLCVSVVEVAARQFGAGVKAASA